jgi:hypothetical protein
LQGGAAVQEGTGRFLCILRQTSESRVDIVFSLEEKMAIDMWQKKCPVCRQQMEKKLPTETVSCPCGKYVWKG